jgi:hypothetical protein
MTLASLSDVKGKYKCRICPAEFDTLDELRFHQQLGHLK